MGTVAYLGLGSNLGDRLANLTRAVGLLAESPALRVVASSRVWETDPVGGPPQPDYLNTVVRAELADGSTAHDLLAAAHRVEEALGRVREVRWGARTIDVDVLLVGSQVLDDEDLTLPHPRMTERAFVVLPLLELAPDLTLPNGRRLRDVRLPDAHGARPAFPAPPIPT